jgi:hypothetical protein
MIMSKCLIPLLLVLLLQIPAGAIDTISVDQFKTAFNQASDEVRIVSLLSPT